MVTDLVHVSDSQLVPWANAKDMLNRTAWVWIRDNKERVIFSKRLWFFNVTIRVKDLVPLFREMFGPPPFAWE